MNEGTGPAPGKESGPAEGTPTKTPFTSHPTTSTDSFLHRHDVVPLPLRWAKTLIDAAGGPVPAYGTREWSDLPDGPQKVAGCVLAAESWRTRHHQSGFLLGSGSRRAREIAEARRPRPGDYPGGHVRGNWNEVAAGE